MENYSATNRQLTMLGILASIITYTINAAGLLGYCSIRVAQRAPDNACEVPPRKQWEQMDTNCCCRGWWVWVRILVCYEVQLSNIPSSLSFKVWVETVAWSTLAFSPSWSESGKITDFDSFQGIPRLVVHILSSTFP